MGLLENIRSYHDDEDRFRRMTIRGDLFDVRVYAHIERHFAEFLRLQIKYFPYILKSQWRAMYGKDRKTSHYALQELIEMKVLSEGQFMGCHYVFPATRAMKWYFGDPNARNMEPRVTDRTLIDHFMRVDFFLQHERPLYVEAKEAFKDFDTFVSKLPRDVINFYMPSIDPYRIEDEFVPVFGNKVSRIQLDTALGVTEMVKEALDVVQRRNCYIEEIALDRENGFRLAACVVHFDSSGKSRYHTLIRDLSLICNCFEHNTLTLRVITECAREEDKARDLLEQVMAQRARQKLLNGCQSVTITNLNTSRYYQKGDTDTRHSNEADEEDYTVGLPLPGTRPNGEEGDPDEDDMD